MRKTRDRKQDEEEDDVLHALNNQTFTSIHSLSLPASQNTPLDNTLQRYVSLCVCVRVCVCVCCVTIAAVLARLSWQQKNPLK